MPRFLTLQETADLLRLERGTVENKMRLGILKQGVHWFKRRGELHVLFDQEAVIQWVREGNGEEKTGGIPMARGYKAGAKGL